MTDNEPCQLVVQHQCTRKCTRKPEVENASELSYYETANALGCSQTIRWRGLDEK